MRRSLVRNAFAPDPSEFPNIWGKFSLLFYQCAGNRAIKGAYKPGTARSCRDRDVACRNAMNPESICKILGRNWDKSLQSFPPWYSQSPLLTDFISLPSLEQKCLKLGLSCKHCIRKPKVRELSRLCPETSTKLYVCGIFIDCVDKCRRYCT